jgi:triosephosphate isomerase
MTDAPRPLVAGNWKMNGLRADGVALARAIADLAGPGEGPAAEVLLCPPATLLADVGAALAGSSVRLGAQDCHPEERGAHTGDVSAEMLADLGCAYVIVGHSERRADHGEGDALARAKAEAAHRAGLAAIVCVGEREAERDAGRTLEVVSAQLAGSLPDGAGAGDTVIAYEPVWAIGSGRTPTPAEVAEVHGHLRDDLARRLGPDGAGVRLLYGGSVKPDNAAELMAVANVNGALVGGASLDADGFWRIVESCP